MIRNTNTGRLHEDGCRAISMMNPKHIDRERNYGKYCHWCGGTVETDDLDTYSRCHDPYLVGILEEMGCLMCHSKDGEVQMYPHEGGTNVKGGLLKQWVFFHCDRCEYDTNYKKSIIRYKLKEMDK